MNSGINSQKLFYVISSFFLIVLIIFTLRVNYASSAAGDGAEGGSFAGGSPVAASSMASSGIIGAAAAPASNDETREDADGRAAVSAENVPAEKGVAKEKNDGANVPSGGGNDAISSIISVEKIKKMPGDFSIVIDKSRFKLYLFKGGKLVKKYPVSIGRNPDGADKRQKGDLRTPEGNFHIVSIHKSDKWLHEGQLAYGPWFLRLKTPWQGIGIHGTNEPEKLGTKASEGCIRLHSDNIAELKKLVEDQVNSKKKVKVDIVAKSDGIE